MACGSGCCGKPISAPPEQINSHPASTQDDRNSGGGADNDKDEEEEEEEKEKEKKKPAVYRSPNQSGPASATPTELSEEDDCCAPDLKPATPGCKKGCCYASDEPVEEDKCCVPKPKSTAAECQSGCCSAPKPPPPEDIPVPSCCEGKSAPCCDESCLDRLALRECEKSGSPTATHSSTASHCSRGKDGKPCVNHANKARLTYAERLEAFGCICRALVAIGQESCCLPPRRSPTKTSHRRSGDIQLFPSRSADSCCGTDERPVNRVKKNNSVEILSTAIQPADLEKAIVGSEKEHVILSISGMTCTGCEAKLARALSAHPVVKNVKTSLVLSRAEFDVTESGSAVDVMKHLERTTEFKCERVVNRGSNLDLIPPGGDMVAFINQPWPDGVTEVRAAGNKTVNVSFDAKIIGARDLVTSGWTNGPIDLAPPRPDSTLEAGSKHVRHAGYMTFLSVCLTIPVLVMAWAPLPERPIEYSSASLALATVAQFVIAGPFYLKALKSFIFSRIIEMDLLIVLSTSAAYIFSVVSFGYLVVGQPLSTGEFFETSTLLVTLIMVGRWVSALARQKAVESISVRSLQISTALILDGARETEIDARLLQYGDVFKVLSDSRIPTDGTVISGSSEVNESMITGESKLVEKHAKSRVIAGSINGSGVLLVRLTRLPGDNTISTIARMVDEAKLSKPKIQDLANRVASYFVPVVVALTIVTFVIWVALGVAVRRQAGSEATIQAITYAIAVLIVSCPCAIGLAVPMVVVIATGVAAERGIIFKSAESIEVAYKTAHVVFDKTGTITQGKLSVAREWYAETDQNTTKSLLLGLIGGTKHPVSVAIATNLKAQGVLPSPISDSKVLTGKGVEGAAKGSGVLLRAGNSRWLKLDSHLEVQSMLSQGHTVFCFTIAGSVAAVFGLQDTIRPDAAPTVKTLLERGISVHIISGDDDGAVRSVAAQLNIAETNVRSRCTPSEKQVYVQTLLAGTTSRSEQTVRGCKENPAIVMFCGDGTNDAPALAQATIGVHVNQGGGTDVANNAADVVLLRPDLTGILTVVDLSAKSVRRIVFNFAWSFVYNLLAILLATGAFVRARIPPEFAGLGELVSVLPVIAAAALLRWSKI